MKELKVRRDADLTPSLHRVPTGRLGDVISVQQSAPRSLDSLSLVYTFSTQAYFSTCFPFQFLALVVLFSSNEIKNVDVFPPIFPLFLFGATKRWHGVTGGFNIFPREVEDVVAEVPAVAQVGVIGVPDEKWGEAVTAVVVLKPGTSADLDTLTAAIQALVRDRKGPVHVPKRVIIAESLPLTGLGKPDKKALRARYGG